MNKTLFVLLFVLCSSPFCLAQINVWENPKPNRPIEAVQWEVNDVVYRVRKNVTSPFKKNIYARVTGDDGEQKIPLFYNGDNSWVFRYSSSTIGNKTFVLESEIKELGW